MKRSTSSLQARALTWLAQREQSRSELRRKLFRLVRLQAEQADPIDRADADPPEPPAEDPATQVERLLDVLQAQGLLSDERFVESRVRARAPGMGTRRIEAELARHGLKLAAQPLQGLRDSELRRARRLWLRRFGGPAEDDKTRARQMRFLAGRGFSSDVIRRVLAGESEPDADETAGD